VETLVTLLASTLVGTGFFLWRLPVGECSQCAHCQSEKAARARDEELRASRFYGIPFCPTCERNHYREEPHRRT
jgi:hypothetical protein